MKFLLAPALTMLALHATLASATNSVSSTSSTATANSASAASSTKPVLPKDDVVFRALNDEMQRSMQRLHLDQYKGPYFIAYRVDQSDEFTVVASFGALDNSRRTTKRELNVDVREGDYALDSSHSSGGSISHLLGMQENTALTIDDNYDPIRHELWLHTDSAYKRAIEDLAAKKAFLQENEVKERPDSMSHEKPVVSIEPVAHLDVDMEKSSELVKKLSTVFREYPRVQKSFVSLGEDAATRWFLNSEGFANRTPTQACAMMAIASAQADDGSLVSDIELLAGQTEKDLPPYPEMEKRVRGLAERVTKLASAKTIDQYRGPVLFENEAAAEFFAQVLQPNLGHSPESLNKFGHAFSLARNALAEKLGTRILPTFISVVDDPLTTHFGKTPILSSYKVDDDGVRAQKITLVDKGFLKTFAMSRNPSREIKQSNGHSENGSGVAGNIYIQSDNKLSPAKLREKLMAMGKEDGLKEVLVVKRLSNFAGAALEPKSLVSSLMASTRSEVKLLPPVIIYKISIEDGHEEPVRSAEFGNMTMRVLRDIEATGDDLSAYPIISMATSLHRGGGMELSTIVTPSVLIREIELQKPSKQTELPPILKNPYFDK
jgi:predicted Zn-dependent protease